MVPRKHPGHMNKLPANRDYVLCFLSTCDWKGAEKDKGQSKTPTCSHLRRCLFTSRFVPEFLIQDITDQDTGLCILTSADGSDVVV